MAEDTPKPKRERARRRNFAKIVTDLEAYCEAALDILPTSEAEKREVYTKILEKVRTK